MAFPLSPIPPDWQRIGAHHASHIAVMREDWILYERTNRSDDLWISLYLRHVDLRFRKKAYWCGWHIREQRLSNTSDMAILNNRFPEIYAWLIRLCGNAWPRPQRSQQSSRRSQNHERRVD